MGARRRIGSAAALAAVLLAGSRAEASVVTEPIARLALEGGYDSNVLYDGSGGDRIARVSPELGLRARDHLWDLRASYGGDWLYYEQLASRGIWNHRAALSLEARPGRRTQLTAALRGAWAFDPVGLAQAGVFRAGRESALLVAGRARAEHRATRRLDLAGTFAERTVRFEDATGGAMHAPGVEALWRVDPRLSAGVAYGAGIFQGFDADGSDLAWSHGLRARARWRGTRHVTVDAGVGPALWLGPDGTALVPEAWVEAVAAVRDSALRVTAFHGLGIGTTARPGLVNSLELGAERRFGRRGWLHADGGLWHSGAAPDGAHAVLGLLAAGEAGLFLTERLRVSVAASQFARVDDPSPAMRRTIVGLRLGWELPLR